PGPFEIFAHSRPVEPPIVVPEHGHDAVGRAQPGQVCGRRLRRDEPAEQHVVDDEVAQDHDEVRMRAVRSRHDLVELVETVAERADMEVGEDGDAQRRPRGGPAPGADARLADDQPPRSHDDGPAQQDRARQRRRGRHRQREARAPLHPTTNVGTLPPPALTLMTELREARVTAPTSAPWTKNGFTFTLSGASPTSPSSSSSGNTSSGIWTRSWTTQGSRKPSCTAAAHASGAVSSPTSTDRPP